jgi:hypothetical protein
VNAENLVETLSSLLNKLNDTGEEMDESSRSNVVAAEAAAASAAAAAEAVKAAATVAVAVEVAAAVAAAAVATAVEAAAVAAAAVVQPRPPVVYSHYTRPSLVIKFDKDAFKVKDKNGKQKSEAAARMGKSRAVNVIVNTILADYFSPRFTPEQLVLALHEASKHHRVRMLFNRIPAMAVYIRPRLGGPFFAGVYLPQKSVLLPPIETQYVSVQKHVSSYILKTTPVTFVLPLRIVV